MKSGEMVKEKKNKMITTTLGAGEWGSLKRGAQGETPGGGRIQKFPIAEKKKGRVNLQSTASRERA